MSNISISNLRGYDFSSLYRTYMHAFSDYHVPYHISEEQFGVALQQVNYDPTLSFGAFEPSGRMVGFWFSSWKETSNGIEGYGEGTGVIPGERRNGVGTKLFTAVEQGITTRRIANYSLEVDEENESAIAFYAKCGFGQSAVHYVYSAEILPSQEGAAECALALREVSLNELSAIYRGYLEYRPCSYNSFEAMQRIGSSVRAFIVERGGLIMGYGIIQPDRSRISQLGIQEGNNAVLVAKKLFMGLSECRECEDPLNITGVPASAKWTISFLREAGFVQAGLQYEMAKVY